MPNWTDTFYKPVRFIMIDLRMFLDTYEREVLFFIFSRTGPFNKTREFISITQFLNGIMTKDGNSYVAAPVGISKTKLLEALRLLEAKGIIEVRHGNRTTRNEYRIKTIEEIDISHVQDYMERHQPSLFEATFKRLHRRDPTLRITNRVNAAIQNTHPRSIFRPRVGQPEDQEVGPNMDYNNIHTNKKPKVNLAPPTAGARRGTTTIRKITLGGKSNGRSGSC